jgi:hypothetical protein
MSLSDTSLAQISSRLHGLDISTKDRFFLCLTVQDADKSHVANTADRGTTSSDTTAMESQQGQNKRRLSKAEKKKLAKDKEKDQEKEKEKGGKATSEQVQAHSKEESEGVVDLEQDAMMLSGNVETSPLTLLFVGSWTNSSEETSTDFASHWMLLTPPEVYESLYAVLG